MSQATQRKRKLARGAISTLVGVMLLAGSARANEIDPWTFAYAGLDHFYNVEYEEAIADFESAIARDPRNPVFYNFLANIYLFQELKHLGQLDGNLYDASNSFLKAEKPKPDPNQMAKIKNTLAKARALCKARLREDPRDADALYALGASYGIEANYKFTIERSWFQALRAGSKANDLHEKVLKIDPGYHDAKLIPGLYQYVVGSIPRGIKWFAFMIGYRGSKEKGIRLLQEAMQGGKIVTSDAATLLALIYSREKDFNYARTLLGALIEYYPRNALLRLEYGRTYSRERKGKEALEVYAAVARDMEAGRPGYDKLPRA
ncbi:MAG: tetratricopeptide repeat protein, partial [Terriglobia bacterium]